MNYFNIAYTCIHMFSMLYDFFRFLKSYLDMILPPKVSKLAEKLELDYPKWKTIRDNPNSKFLDSVKFTHFGLEALIFPF